MMLTQEQLKEMIGDEPYYLELNAKRKTPFNWAAAILWPFWLPYRNLYFLYIPLLMLHMFPTLFWVPILISGFWGNKIYFQFLEDMHKAGYRQLTANVRAASIMFICMIIFYMSIGCYFIYTQTPINLGIFQLFAFSKAFRFIGGFLFAAISFAALWFFAGERRKQIFFYPIFR